MALTSDETPKQTAKEKLGEVVDKVKDKAMDVVVRSLEIISAEHVADLIVAAEAKKAAVNAALQERGSPTRVTEIVVGVVPSLVVELHTDGGGEAP